MSVVRVDSRETGVLMTGRTGNWDFEDANTVRRRSKKFLMPLDDEAKNMCMCEAVIEQSTLKALTFDLMTGRPPHRS